MSKWQIGDVSVTRVVEMEMALPYSPDGPAATRCSPPGQTAGHVSVVIESKGERALNTGDMRHHPRQVGHPDWSSSFDSDPFAGAKTRRSVMERVAGQPILVIGTHFATPTAGRVKRDGGAFRFDIA